MLYTGKLHKVGALVLAVGCSGPGMVTDEGASAAGPEPSPLITPEALYTRLGESGVVLLHADFGTSRFDSAHIAGARWLDMDSLVWEGDPAWGTELRPVGSVKAALEAAGVSDGDHVVIYSHNPLYASRAFLTIEVMGFEGPVSVLDGGFAGWRESGFPVAAGAMPAAAGRVNLAPRDDIMVSAEWIAERLGEPGMALIDARPDDEYTGADDGMGGISNPGHIPGAHQMYWEELIEARARPWVHPEDSVEALFTSAGAMPGDTVVAYCMVGWRASFTYLAARLTGREVRFYDGSWHDWGMRDDLPFVGGEQPGG